MAFSAAAGEKLKPFGAGSLAEITHSRVGHPFVLMLWSLDCPSCMKELDALSASIKKHPGLKLVLVSTDEYSMSEEAVDMLNKHGLGGLESWIFSGSDAQRLRYEIDPSWFGELPRSYFYDASHRRRAHVGVLKGEELDAWAAEIGAKD